MNKAKRAIEKMFAIPVFLMFLVLFVTILGIERYLRSRQAKKKEGK